MIPYPTIQQHLKEEKIDGWLIYSFQHTNPPGLDLLGLSKEAHITRRLLFWIPQEGTPTALVHAVEKELVKDLPGNVQTYDSWQSYQTHVATLLETAKTIALETHPSIPYISLVDAGTIDHLRSLGKTVVSSEKLLQLTTACLDKEAQASHLRASEKIVHLFEQGWQWIRDHTGLACCTEKGLQTFFLEQLEHLGLTTDWSPIVATGAHTANPHHTPDNTPLKEGDFLLVDMGAKEPGGIYCDYTKMALLGRNPTPREQEVFSLVKEGVERACRLLNETPSLCGYQLDKEVRSFFETQGVAPYFVHRLGHSITTLSHGTGTHLDSFETHDTRELLDNTCFSIEPGLYFPQELGVRLEINVLYTKKNPLITGNLQKNLLII